MNEQLNQEFWDISVPSFEAKGNEIKVNNVKINIVLGNLVTEKVDAITNPANS